MRQKQLELLRLSLQRLKDTEFGRDYQVEATWNYGAFREKIPVFCYEELLHYLQAPSGILNEKVRTWEPTGGSTGGGKWIPWTRLLQEQFQAAICPWLYQLFRRHPQVKAGRSFWQLTPKSPVVSPPWLEKERLGFQSDGDYLGWWGKTMEKFLTVPCQQSSDQYWENTVKALVKAPDLRLISCWSPSYLVLLTQHCRELFGTWDPQKWWPDLSVISCWDQGPSRALASEVRSTFPNVTFQGKGLLSTEAICTIPIEDQYPLAYLSHFFEFRDESGQISPSWEIALGQRYEVVVTTGGGLIRYATGDLVSVDSYWRDVPCLTFLGRDALSDFFGEKLHHHFLSQVLNSLGQWAYLCFEDQGYVLLLRSTISLEEAKTHCFSVERALKSVYTYQDCLNLKQLRPLRCFLWNTEDSHPQLDKFGQTKPNPILDGGPRQKHWSGKFVL